MKYVFLVILQISVASIGVRAGVPECEQLAEAAGRSHGIPPGIMSAIARVETGRTVDGRFRAWPWTLNQAGRGSYHADKASALKALEVILATGARNVDVGCMQINWRWHAAEFRDLSKMMDPVENTRYAAQYLSDLYERLGDWDSAVMQYHSRDRQLGAAYARKVTRERERMGQSSADASAPPASSEPVLKNEKARGLLAQPFRAVIDLSPKAGSRMQ